MVSKNKRTAEVAFKTEGAEEKKDVSMKIEDESEQEEEEEGSDDDSDGSNNTPVEEAMLAAWAKLNVPWKDDGLPEDEPEIPAIKVVKGENVLVAQSAGYVVLGCKPYMVNSILSQPGMKDALHGKVLILIRGGVTNEDLEKAVYGNYDPNDETRCRFIRVMPNTAAKINQSMTVIATPPDKPLSNDEMEIVDFISSCVGELVDLPADKMDAATDSLARDRHFVY